MKPEAQFFHNGEEDSLLKAIQRNDKKRISEFMKNGKGGKTIRIL